MKLSETIILKLLKEKTNRPMKMSELIKKLSVPDDQRREFRSIIKEMTTEGSLIKIRGGRYGLPEEMNLVSGTLEGHTNGFGFLVSDLPDDIYINRRNMGEAMHRDRVVVRVESHGRFDDRLEGKVIRILERKTIMLIGTYQIFEQQGWVVPSEQKFFHDVLIAPKHKNGAKSGQRVCVEITTYPTGHHPPCGRIIEILGYSNDPEVEVKIIIRNHKLSKDFSYNSVREARQFSSTIDADEREKRADLTDQMIFTIDGENAKDFDDAVSIENTRNGFLLGVHISDVSHFVQAESALDQEAFERGTSVYFPNDVIPMLPFELSHEICSLKPHVERLTVSVIMEIDRAGEVLSYKTFNSIIKSRHRLTYTQVSRFIEEGQAEDEFNDVLPSLKLMGELSRILRKQRFRAGSVNFNIPEAEIRLDPTGNVADIRTAEHNLAHEIIEEFMLSTNRIVAEELSSFEIPSIHRIHEPPNIDKLETFNQFIKGFGLKLSNINNLQPADLQKLIKKVRGTPKERVVNTLLLRSLKKALYSEKDPGHFCLAFEHYTHFTSPIRRYPDLVTHRILKSSLKRKLSGREKTKLRSLVVECAEQSSHMEIKAMKVEREINDLRRAQFMANKVGKIYDGIISSVTSFGFFVELDKVFVEGLVHVSTLTNDYYLYLENEHKWLGTHKGLCYQIGDPVTVRVSQINIALRRIDFILVSGKK
ncbi:MAG: ribonuclease R [Nitrospinota bacterium]|nr:ribonuclease R [Nitrospinota bacterium]